MRHTLVPTLVQGFNYLLRRKYLNFIAIVQLLGKPREYERVGRGGKAFLADQDLFIPELQDEYVWL
jgi:hypothetical protein